MDSVCHSWTVGLKAAYIDPVEAHWSGGERNACRYGHSDQKGKLLQSTLPCIFLKQTFILHLPFFSVHQSPGQTFQQRESPFMLLQQNWSAHSHHVVLLACAEIINVGEIVSRRLISVISGCLDTMKEVGESDPDIKKEEEKFIRGRCGNHHVAIGK